MDADFTRNLLDILFEGVYFVDRDRKVSYWSKGAERITGYKEQEVLGLRCRDSILMHVDERGERACGRSCLIAESIREGEAREADLYLLHKDGHRVPVSIRVAPIVDPGGRIAGAVEVFSDNPTKDTTTRLIAELRGMGLLGPVTERGDRGEGGGGRLPRGHRERQPGPPVLHRRQAALPGGEIQLHGRQGHHTRHRLRRGYACQAGRHGGDAREEGRPPDVQEQRRGEKPGRAP